jgi:hypothetical protein
MGIEISGGASLMDEIIPNPVLKPFSGSLIRKLFIYSSLTISAAEAYGLANENNPTAVLFLRFKWRMDHIT